LGNYIIAKYIRLSIEDSKSDSMSIENQRLLLNRHICSMGLPDTEIREFVDNGYSGTNFERPAVQELLELVRLGQVDCIAVKDFSRFGRSAIEVGYFIERVFPLFGVRFISVSDGFDSAEHAGDTGGMEVSFKFIMHEYYSRDLSRKIKSAKQEKVRRGEYIPKNCAFGYKKVNGQLEIDEPAADTVRRIFQLAREDLSCTSIATRLLLEKRTTPSEYKKGITDSSCRWGVPAISTVLRDEQYVGTYVSGKTEIPNVGSKKTLQKAESEWVKIPDHHPAIVTREVFDAIQAGSKKRKRAPMEKKTKAAQVEAWQKFSRFEPDTRSATKTGQAIDDRRQAYERYVMGEICEDEYRALCGR